MTEPVKADAVLHQYMAATINGGPVLDEERTTELDGKTVRHRAAEARVGTVLGASRLPGFAWVRWDSGHTGLHREIDLKEVSDD